MSGADRDRQLTSIFAEEPVPLEVFVADTKFLGNPELSLVQYDAVRAIERVLYPETYALMASEWGSYWDPIQLQNFICLQWAKGSGKDHICRIGSLRVCYLLNCMHDPLTYYGMPSQDTIHVLNVASSSNQAQQAFFMPMSRAVKRGWFADKCEPKQNSISWEKNVECISGHSDAESQEGLNILLGIADEIDAFKTKEEIERYRGRGLREPVKSAEAILKMMRTSSSTRFPDVYKNVRISYPRFKGSTIQRLTRLARDDIKAKGDKSRHYVSGPLCTWEVNPRVKGKEDFAEDYAEDESMARGMYECDPQLAQENLYFTNLDAWAAAEYHRDDQPLEIQYLWENNAWQVRFHFAPWLTPIEGARYALHGDIAINGDRAGIAMSHVKSWKEGDLITEDERGREVKIPTSLPLIKTDFVASFEADLHAPNAPREVQVRWYRQLLWELQRRGFYVARYTFDQFQSTDSQQIIELAGVETDTVSMDRNDLPWKSLRDVVYDGRLEIQYREQLRAEIFALGRTSQGKVDHPPGGCFVGETRIPLLSGADKPIADLVGLGDVWVYSATPKGKIVPGVGRARLTKHVSHLVDVVLDSGAVVRCTPEHRFMLRDGHYIEAQKIRPGIDLLMPRTEVGINHKVRRVVRVELDHPVPVFDLEVDEWSNFLLAAGVVVHNSKDEADALCGSVVGALHAGGAEDAEGGASIAGGLMGPGGTDDYLEFDSSAEMTFTDTGDGIGDFDFFGLDDSNSMSWM